MDVRDRLVAAAVDLLAAGPDAVQIRKVAALAGTSTMAVYSQFGGMPGLVTAMGGEGFARLGAALSQVPRTADPLADLVMLGIAYHDFAVANPELYRVMFGVNSIHGHRVRLGDPVDHGSADAVGGTPTDPVDGAGRTGGAGIAGQGPPRGRPDPRAAGQVSAGLAALAAFDVLASAVAAAAAAGRVGDEPPRALAGQVWSAMHGYVLLEIAGFTGPETQSQVLAPMMAKILNAPELSPGEPT